MYYMYVSNYVEQYGAMTVNEGDEAGRTPLMIACVIGNKEVVDYLLKLGAGVNTECSRLRSTSLHYVCECKDELSHMAERPI